MELSNRLKAICDLCDRGNTVADIGCDHGYVSITLVNKGIFDKALAMDINEGPLRLASQNIQLYGDSSRIETRLSSGLDKLECGEADAIIIAGMGGILVRDILAAGYSKLLTVKQLILGAQSDLNLVRRYLRDIGFRISDEDMIYEDGKYYQLIKAVPDMEHIGVSDDLADSTDVEVKDRFGPVLLKEKNEILGKFLLHSKNVTSGLIEKLEDKILNRSDDRIAGRIEELRYDLKIIDRALELFEL